MNSTNEPTTETPVEQEPPDAWSARMMRDPLGVVPVDVIALIGPSQPSNCESSPVVETIRRRGRLGRVVPVRVDPAASSFGSALESAIREVQAPIFVISDIATEWNRDILDRLLKAIDICDLAIGARPCPSFVGRAKRWLAAFGRGVFWGAGVLDPHSPFRMGRTERFRAFPLQSTTRFAEIELIAKANFLDALIHEEVLPVCPAWIALPLGRGVASDKHRLFRHPSFRFEAREMTPAEEESVETDSRTQRFNPESDTSSVPPEDVRTHDTGG